MAEEHAVNWIAVLIIIIVVLIVFISVMDAIGNLGLVRRLTCSLLFWIPFGSLIEALAEGCAFIPV